ncbi:MAG: response regulator [Chloroflexi bacterium]|nr:response regulator [Chloroflexota bacterium]
MAARRWQFQVPLRTWVVAVSLIVVIVPLLVVGILWVTASPAVALAAGLLTSMGMSVGLVNSLGRLARQTAVAGAGKAVTPSPLPIPPISQPRVLLVEDDRVSQRIALRLLERLGVQADAVTDGQPAVDAVTTQTYALVLMDCQLPTLDGFAATAAIRQWEAAQSLAEEAVASQADRASATPGQPRPRLPIVALTAATDDDARQHARDAGMDDHLAKPLDAARLAATLERWGVRHTPPTPAADRGSSTATASATAPAAAPASSADAAPPSDVAAAPPLASDPEDASDPAPAQASLPVLDPDVLLIVDGRLSAPYQEVVEVFLQEVPRRRRLLQEGMARQDIPQVVRVAHTLAGSAGSIGAMRLAAACSALETLAKAASLDTSGPADQTVRDRPPEAGKAVSLTQAAASLTQAAETVSQELRQLEAVLVRLVAAR